MAPQDPADPVPGRPAGAPPLPDDASVLASLLGVADVLVVVLDAQGRILQVSRAAERALGFPLEALRGSYIWDRVVAPADREAAREIFGGLLAGGDLSSRRETPCATRDGRTRLVRWSGTMLAGAEGRPGWCVLAGSDITEERRARDEVAEREARLRAILDTAVESIITIDEKGTVESVNPATVRMFGYAADEVVGRNVSMLMPEAIREEHDGYIRRFLDDGVRRIIGIGREVDARRKDGSFFAADLSVSEVRLPGKRAFVGMLRDVSGRRRAEEETRSRLNELAHASRLLELGEMTSGIAHEVNQPLAAIGSFADASLRMMEAGTGDDDLVREALTQISGQAQRAGEIIQRLRRFVRKGETERERLDVNDMVRGVLDLLRHEVRRNEVRVSLHLGPTLPAVLADRIQIEQVTVNLVRNAIEAMGECAPDARVLGLATRLVDGSVEVCVADTGCGLPEDAAGKLFGTFYTTKPAGMGVGLSISRSIIEAHGGRLWASSNPEGGATFRFRLSRAEVDGDGDD